jgi:hypothetical protein
MTTTDDEITDEQRKEGFDVFKRIIEGQKVEIPRWMTEARERADRIQAAMQKQLDARDRDKPAQNPTHAATASTFRTDRDDLPTLNQKGNQQAQPDPAATRTETKYSEEDMFVFTDDLGERVR